jgi:anti-sigma factor RsiW
VNAASACPHPEEFSALIDRELKPDRIPELESHIGHCRICRELFLRLSAADRMFALSLGGVDLLGECLAVTPGRDVALPEALCGKLEAFGRAEMAKATKETERAAARRRRRRRVLVLLLLLLLAGAFAASLQLSPVRDPGEARRTGALWSGPAEVVLCDGTAVRLSEDGRARFWCAFRWERPSAALHSGSLTVKQGQLGLRSGNQTVQLTAGQSASAKSDGTVSIDGAAKPQAPAAEPASTGGG